MIESVSPPAMDVAALSSPVQPDTLSSPAVEEQAEPAPPTRSFWGSVTYQFLLSDSLEPSPRHGFGAAITYEFHVSPTLNIGLLLAYRGYPGTDSLQQLGYGVTLKHFFTPAWSTANSWFPFLDYGLLQQQTFLSGHSGAAISHDTRLGVGLLFPMFGLRWSAACAGHLSRLEYFDVEARWVPYVELQFGPVLVW